MPALFVVASDCRVDDGPAQVISHLDYPEESANSRTIDRYSVPTNTESQTTRTSSDED